jgi:hypothetical protein
VTSLAAETDEGDPGALVAERIGPHVLVSAGDTAERERRFLACLPAVAGQLFVMASRDAYRAALRTELPEILRPVLADRPEGLQAVWVAVDELAAHPEQLAALAGEYDVDVLAPDGPLTVLPGSGVYVGVSTGGSGWQRFRSDVPAWPFSTRYPVPTWEAALAGRAVQAAGAVAEPVLAGVVVRPAQARPVEVGDLAFRMALDPRHPKAVVGGTGPLPGPAAVAAVLGRLPAGIRGRLVLVPAVPDAARHGWLVELVAALGRPVTVATGAHYSAATGELTTVSLTEHGEHHYRPFATTVRQVPDGRQEVLAVAPAPPGWLRHGDTSYRPSDELADDLPDGTTDGVLADVVPSGLVLRASTTDPAAAAPPIPFDPEGWTLYLGAPGEPVGSALLTAAELLLLRLGARQLAAARVRVVGRWDGRDRGVFDRIVGRLGVPVRMPRRTDPAPRPRPSTPEPAAPGATPPGTPSLPATDRPHNTAPDVRQPFVITQEPPVTRPPSTDRPALVRQPASSPLPGAQPQADRPLAVPQPMPAQPPVTGPPLVLPQPSSGAKPSQAPSQGEQPAAREPMVIEQAPADERAADERAGADRAAAAVPPPSVALPAPIQPPSVALPPPFASDRPLPTLPPPSTAPAPARSSGASPIATISAAPVSTVSGPPSRPQPDGPPPASPPSPPERVQPPADRPSPQLGGPQPDGPPAGPHGPQQPSLAHGQPPLVRSRPASDNGRTPTGEGQVPPRAPGQVPPAPGQAPMVPGQPPPVQGQAPLVQSRPPVVEGQAPPGQAPPMPGRTPYAHGQTPPVPGPPPLVQGQAAQVNGQPPQGQGQPPVGQGWAPFTQGQPPLAAGRSPHITGEPGRAWPGAAHHAPPAAPAWMAQPNGSAPPQQAVEPAPEIAPEPAGPVPPAAPEPVDLSQVAAVADRSSTPTEQTRFAASAGEAFGEALATVNAALATWPALRQGDDSSRAKSDYVAVCLYFGRGDGNATALNEAVRRGRPGVLDGHLPCMVSGIRRLPIHRRAVLRQCAGRAAMVGEQGSGAGRLWTEPGFLSASMDLDVTVPGAELDVLIWPATARRTSELMMGRTIDEAVFAAGARFKALAVRTRSDDEDDPDVDPGAPAAPRLAVLIRELAPAETATPSPELDDRDTAVLAKLDRALEQRWRTAIRLLDDSELVTRLTTELVEHRGEAIGAQRAMAGAGR